MRWLQLQSDAAQPACDRAGLGNIFRTYEGGAGWVARTFTREDCAWDDAACPAPCVDDVKLPLDPEAPAQLSETGLYSNITNKTLATYAKVYQPEFPLWSDGADKVRHIYIPKCSKSIAPPWITGCFPVGPWFLEAITPWGLWKTR